MVNTQINNKSISGQNNNFVQYPGTSKIAVIMDEYHAKIEKINTATATQNPLTLTEKSKKENSEIINDCRLRVQQANSVIYELSKDLKKLEVYQKLLVMSRRSLTATGRNY